MAVLVANIAAFDARAAGLDYTVEIAAPRDLKSRLEKGLNLVRWRLDPEMNAERLKRLVDDAVREAREAAATEGYFSANVEADVDSSATPWVVRLKVEPGERTRVGDVEVRFIGPASTDGEARSLLERVREGWTLRRNQPFRQADWDQAKRQALRTLSGWRYAAADLADSQASIDPDGHRAALFVEIESGPPFRFGTLHISGTRRYKDALVENLSSIRAGDTYDRERVVLYQRRLLESGYFASVQAEIDAATPGADAAPLRVSVIEAPKHHVESGIGYNTDVGPKFEARYTNQDVFSSAWRFGSSLNLDEKIQNLQLTLDTPPRPGGVWNSFFTRARQQDIQNERTREIAFGHAYNIGAGAAPAAFITSAHFEDQVLSGVTADNRYAIYFGVRKSFRKTDALVSPREGYVLSGELGGAPQGLSSRAFARGIGSASFFFPVGRDGDLLLRGQAGYVQSHTREGIPSTFLFRTGGDQTVRGYAFESLGVEQNGAIVGGRRLLVGSAEYTYWVGENWGVAGFVDGGNAWDSGVQTTVATGYGVGARVRTPIGPIRADLAYGALRSEFRIHFSVGYGF
ncbi:MAG TPA: BamA/TamA family outer membrane protein [Burkholderiales bacterium]|nr:BamA/TamA family outer membrane protein [Burkholderiales bacterium]